MEGGRARQLALQLAACSCGCPPRPPVGVSCDCEESAVALPKPLAPLDWPLQVSRRFVSAAASSGVPRCINAVWVRYMAEAHECASVLQLWRRCVKRHHLQPDSSYSSSPPSLPNLPIHIILNAKHRRTDSPSRFPGEGGGVRLTRFRLDSFGGFARPLAPHFNDSDSAREFATRPYIYVITPDSYNVLAFVVIDSVVVDISRRVPECVMR